MLITGIITTYLVLRLLVISGFIDTYPVRGNTCRQILRATAVEMRERSDGFVEHNSAMVENFLKLGGWFALPAPEA